MSRTIHPYDAMEKVYVESDLGIRAVARQFGVNAPTVSVQARKRHWVEKRVNYRTLLADKRVASWADGQADKEAKVRDDMLTAIHAAVLQFGGNLGLARTGKDGVKVPVFPVSAQDLVKLIEKYLLLTGKATKIGEERNLGLNFEDVPLDFLRELVEQSRGAAANARPVEGAALPGPSDTR